MFEILAYIGKDAYKECVNMIIKKLEVQSYDDYYMVPLRWIRITFFECELKDEQVECFL